MAKDFGLPTKTIAEILAKYGSAPKNHMQVLTDRELSIIFDRLTQDHRLKTGGTRPGGFRTDSEAEKFYINEWAGRAQ